MFKQESSLSVTESGVRTGKNPSVFQKYSDCLAPCRSLLGYAVKSGGDDFNFLKKHSFKVKMNVMEKS